MVRLSMAFVLRRLRHPAGHELMYIAQSHRKDNVTRACHPKTTNHHTGQPFPSSHHVYRAPKAPTFKGDDSGHIRRQHLVLGSPTVVTAHLPWNPSLISQFHCSSIFCLAVDRAFKQSEVSGPLALPRHSLLGSENAPSWTLLGLRCSMAPLEVVTHPASFGASNAAMNKSHL